MRGINELMGHDMGLKDCGRMALMLTLLLLWARDAAGHLLLFRGRRPVLGNFSVEERATRLSCRSCNGVNWLAGDLRDRIYDLLLLNRHLSTRQRSNTTKITL